LPVAIVERESARMLITQSARKWELKRKNSLTAENVFLVYLSIQLLGYRNLLYRQLVELWEFCGLELKFSCHILKINYFNWNFTHYSLLNPIDADQFFILHIITLTYTEKNMFASLIRDMII
jgi:hypothetical protein